MDTLFNLLPRFFGKQSNRAANSAGETASSYGAFKPTFFPSFIPPRNNEEAQRLYNHIRTTAWYLDAIPYLTTAGLPFKVGIDAIVSAIPIYGDLVGVLLAMYQVFLCFIFGVPRALLGKMVINVVVDGVIGILPIIGDILDALFKANLRNLALLEEWLLKEDNQFTIQVTPSDVFLPRKNRAAPAHSGFSTSSNSPANAKAKYRNKPAAPPARPPQDE